MKNKTIISLSSCLLLCALSVQNSADVPPLTVSGNKVLSGGEAKSFAGNSFFWSNTGWGQEAFYNESAVRWLKDDWKATIVRGAMGADEDGSYMDDPEGNVQRIQNVVEAAIDNDLYVIIDFHSHNAQDKQAEAIAFFQDMATRYGAHNNVIYEIYNEPVSVSWGVIKSYAENVIAAIREIDPDNLIVVGTPNWSQDVDIASNSPITNASNIAYALHFYAGTHGSWLRSKAQTALNNGAALFVTEWGSVNANGDGAPNVGETQAWMDFLKQNAISHLNWAVSDKEEGSSIVKPGTSPYGNWASDDLTAAGSLVKDIVSNWGTTITQPSPTPTPEPSPTLTPTPTIDPTPVPSAAPTAIPTVIPSSDPTPTPAPSPGGVSCELSANTWNSGYQVNVKVSNNSASSLSGWQVKLAFPEGAQFNQGWSAEFEDNGDEILARNLSWNGNLAPGVSTQFGLLGGHDGSFAEPSCVVVD